MNEEQLARTLQSVGQSCFVRFFGEFSSPSMSREDVIEKLRAETNYTEGSCISRTGHARSIINAGLAESALNIVISSDSPRVTEGTREEARRWLKTINS
jgi:hypothetical protein